MSSLNEAFALGNITNNVDCDCQFAFMHCILRERVCVCKCFVTCFVLGRAILMQAVGNIICLLLLLLLLLFLDRSFRFLHSGVTVQTFGRHDIHRPNQAAPTLLSCPLLESCWILTPPSWGKSLKKLHIINIKTTWQKDVYKDCLLIT